MRLVDDVNGTITESNQEPISFPKDKWISFKMKDLWMNESLSQSVHRNTMIYSSPPFLKRNTVSMSGIDAGKAQEVSTRISEAPEMTPKKS